MNVIVNGFHHEEQLPVIDSIVKAVGACGVHCIAERAMSEQLASLFPQCRVLFWEDLFWGGKAAVGNAPLHPLDGALLERMAKWENLAIKMMDRFEFLEDWDYGRRKRSYLDYVQFWHSYLIEYQINALVSQNVPHEVFDFVLYALAREMGIPTLMFYQSQVRDMILPMEHYDRGVIGLDKAIGDQASATAVLPARLETELQSILAGRKPFYMNSAGIYARMKTSISRAIGLLQKLVAHPGSLGRRGIVFRLKIYSRKMIISRRTRKMWREYDSLAETPDFSRPYCYLALHYQPELTTCPLAGPWVDQETIVDLLADCLPEGVELYIKEHPKQTILSRGEGYHARLVRRSNVHLIRRDTDSFELTDHSRCVATCTGTVGWEALVRGKPVLVFGDIFYEACPGAYRIRMRSDLEVAIGEIFRSDGCKANIDEVRRFLLALNSVTIEGFVDPVYRQASSYDFKVSNANVSRYIIGFLASRVEGGIGRKDNGS